MNRKHAPVAALLTSALLAILAFLWISGPDRTADRGAIPVPPVPQLTERNARAGKGPTEVRVEGFAGSITCAGCHAAQAQRWKESHHAKAMQHATPDTVLGDFNNASFAYFGISSTFFRRGTEFHVRTEGPDGSVEEFRILYVFGLTPLQQYLVGFPDGRLQALSIAWDSRPGAEGGQRWFHLYPDTPVRAGDPLHWTRREQNWNWMCAECHSTRVERNFDAASNTYATTFAEINVGCEACHGPGERHLAWATLGADPDTGPALDATTEVTVCSQCHARRAALAAGLSHSGDTFETHDMSLLVAPLYHPDGQQRGEVYTTASFMSSRMYGKGVSCSDCHDPHSGNLRARGNALCSQCHLPARYDTRSHTLHAATSTGAACTACHMPTTVYMGVDARHDHAFRVPRPDQSTTLGTPNACNQCHRDKDAAWAAGVVAQHFGPERKGFQRFGPAFHAAEHGLPGAETALREVAGDASASPIARASAIARLPRPLSERGLSTVENAASSPDALLRGAAMDALLEAPPRDRVRIAAARMNDTARIVRLKAARALAIAPDTDLPPAVRKPLQLLFDEWVGSQRANADRPEPHINLGLFHIERRDPAAAEEAFRDALRLEPDFVPAWLNLADLYRAEGRDSETAKTLEAGIANAGENADLLHAKGLLRIRQGRRSEALELLRRATELAPENPRYLFVLGVALHDSGAGAQAITVLEAALARFPANPDLLSALADYTEEAGEQGRSRAYRERLRTLGADP